VSKGANPDTQIEKQLIWEIAAQLKHWDIVNFLLQNSKLLTNINARLEIEAPSRLQAYQLVNQCLENVIIAAAKANQDDIVLSILPHVSDFKGKNRIYWLHIVAQGECPNSVRYLIQSRRASDHPNERGLYPGHVAAQNGCLKVFQCFLECGFNINAPKNSTSYLYEAALKGHIPLVKFLIENGITLDEYLPIQEGTNAIFIYSPYKWAVKFLNDKDVLNILIESPIVIPDLLKDKNADPQILLLYFAQIGDVKEFSACRKMYKLDIDIATPKGVRPIDKAVQFGQLGMVRYLCEHNASVEKKDGAKLLLVAAKKQYWQIVNYLLRHTNKDAIEDCTPVEINELYNLVKPIKDSIQSIEFINVGISNFAESQARLSACEWLELKDDKQDERRNNKQNDADSSMNESFYGSSSDSESESDSEDYETDPNQEPNAKKRSPVDDQEGEPVKKPRTWILSETIKSGKEEEDKDSSPDEEARDISSYSSNL
jgi:ankyrin repeat protein